MLIVDWNVARNDVTEGGDVDWVNVALRSLRPDALSATTSKLYSWPAASPVTVADVEVNTPTSMDTADCAVPSLRYRMYCVTAAPLGEFML